MVGPNSGSLGRVAWIAGMGVIVAVLACATPPSPGETVESNGDGMSLARELVRVDVQREGEETIITLMGLEDPAYSAYRLDRENTLVIELPGVKQASTRLIAGADDSGGRIPVYDGLVDVVSSSTYEGETEPVTRIEVALAIPADYEVAPTAEGLVVWLRPGEQPVEDGQQTGDLAGSNPEIGEGETVALAETGVEDPWAAAEPVMAGGTEAATQIAEPETDGAELEALAYGRVEPMAPAEPASALRSLDVTVTDGGVLLHLQANGAISAVETFTLENPERLVIDLPGLENEVPSDRIPVESDQVTRVRIGSHPDKLRVVVDGGPEVDGFQGRRLIPAADGLYLAVGMGADLDDALMASLSSSNDTVRMSGLASAAESKETETETIAEGTNLAEEPQAAENLQVADAPAGVQTDWGESTEPASDSELDSAAEPSASAAAEIYGLQYDRTEERDRIAVLSDQVIDYEVLTPDAETVVIRIEHAVISEAVGERITPRAGGPVSLITTFQQPDVPGQEVRVVMKRAPNLEPRLTRRGSLLFVDFENTGVAAAPPPAFLPAEMAAASDPSFANQMDVSEPTLSGEPAPAAIDGLAGTPSEDLSGTGPSAATGVREAASELAAVPANDPMSEMAVPAAEAAAAAISTADGSAESTSALPLLDEATPVAIAAADEDWSVPIAEVASGTGAPPASLEPPAAVEILEEGGLIDGKEYRGRRISLDFKDVEISDVLRLIAEVSDLNIIAGDEVAGKITIRLVDVPWDQTLDVILLTRGLGFVRVGNVLRIAPAEILKVEEEVRLQERRNREKLEDLEVKLQPVNYAAVKDVAKLVKRLLSPRGTVNTDERTNTLIIKDIGAVIDEATALIQAIDTQTPQVMIEARIVEANLEFARELGSTWSVGTQPWEDGFKPQDPRRDLGNENFKFKGDNNVLFGNPITSAATGSLTLGAFLLDERMAIDVHIQAMEASGDGKVISSPRIVTLDNREAMIEQGVSIPFQTFENGDATLEFIDAVLSLKVTPHITTDKSIIMSLEVTRNAPDTSVSTPTGSPAIAKNQAKTETLVRDGQTLVIGGIYTIEKTTRETRVPYLHRIPVLGAAFKSKIVNDLRKELLIFVTPRIVVNPPLAAN